MELWSLQQKDDSQSSGHSLAHRERVQQSLLLQDHRKAFQHLEKEGILSFDTVFIMHSFKFPLNLE